MNLCINYDFCTMSVNVRYAGVERTLSERIPTAQLTQKGRRQHGLAISPDCSTVNAPAKQSVCERCWPVILGRISVCEKKEIKKIEPWLCSVRTRSESPPLFAQNEGSSLPCSGSCLIAATGLARGGSVITCRRCWQCGRRLLAGAAPGPRSDGVKQACHHRERNARRVRRGARPDCGLSQTGD